MGKQEVEDQAAGPGRLRGLQAGLPRAWGRHMNCAAEAEARIGEMGSTLGQTEGEGALQVVSSGAQMLRPESRGALPPQWE